MMRFLTTALVLGALASPAFAGSCADDIAALDARAKGAATEAIASSSGGQKTAAARQGQSTGAAQQGERAAPEAPPEKSAEAGKGGDAAQQARVALEEARTADEKGDAAACAEAVSRARKQLESAP